MKVDVKSDKLAAALVVLSLFSAASLVALAGSANFGANNKSSGEITVSPGDDIQAKISELTDGGIVKFNPGTYSFTSTLLVDKGVSLVGLQDAAGNKPMLNFSSIPSLVVNAPLKSVTISSLDMVLAGTLRDAASGYFNMENCAVTYTGTWTGLPVQVIGDNVTGVVSLTSNTFASSSMIAVVIDTGVKAEVTVNGNDIKNTGGMALLSRFNPASLVLKKNMVKGAFGISLRDVSGVVDAYDNDIYIDSVWLHPVPSFRWGHAIWVPNGIGGTRQANFSNIRIHMDVAPSQGPASPIVCGTDAIAMGASNVTFKDIEIDSNYALNSVLYVWNAKNSTFKNISVKPAPGQTAVVAEYGINLTRTWMPNGSSDNTFQAVDLSAVEANKAQIGMEEYVHDNSFQDIKLGGGDSIVSDLGFQNTLRSFSVAATPTGEKRRASYGIRVDGASAYGNLFQSGDFSELDAAENYLYAGPATHDNTFKDIVIPAGATDAAAVRDLGQNNSVK